MPDVKDRTPSGPGPSEGHLITVWLGVRREAHVPADVAVCPAREADGCLPMNEGAPGAVPGHPLYEAEHDAAAWAFAHVRCLTYMPRN